MVSSVDGPWWIAAALVILFVAVRREGIASADLASRNSWREVGRILVITLVAAIARLGWGIWGPLHVNGQGPLWVRGALEPSLFGYGPGYYELFNWIVSTSAFGPPDESLFAANAILSALSPALLYLAARASGVGRGGALAVALALAADAVSVRTAATEGYLSSIIFLILGAYLSTAIAVRCDERNGRLAASFALVAAGLFAASAARIHPVAYLPIALAPLVALGAEQQGGWRYRATRALVAGVAVVGVVLLTSGTTVVAALSGAETTGQAFGRPAVWEIELVLGLLAAAAVLHRRLKPPWLPLLGIASLVLLLLTQGAFQEHALQKLSYQRLFWPGILLGGAPLLPRKLQGAGWSFLAAAAVSVAMLLPVLPHLDKPTTEQLEYRFLQETLRQAPADCVVAAVSRAGKRVLEIPSYLVPPSGARGPGRQRTLESPPDLAATDAACLLYVHSSLCSSAEGRSKCEAVEREARLERVGSAVFPAAPSYADLPYDRPEVEVAVYRFGTAEASSQRPSASVGDGAPITPEFAKSLFDRIAVLREADGCALAHFDTSRFRISIGLKTRAGAEYALELATAPPRGGVGRRAGDWLLAAPAELERDCAATLASIETLLSATASPRAAAWDPEQVALVHANIKLLSIEIILLVLFTGGIVARELVLRRPPLAAVLALVFIWVVALALRLTVSPQTLLHELFHGAEMIRSHLTGSVPPGYGKTGPALFRLVGAWLGRPGDVQVIFLTNAVISSLAIPAVAMLDLALQRSWPRALCAAALLCVLPQHLRFSAAEDLIVQAATFGLSASALFALYLRTRRLFDALAAVLAISLAMQTRPEMIIFPAVLAAMVALAMPRSWRVVFTWQTIAATFVLAALLAPRFLEVQGAVQGSSTSLPTIPSLVAYLGVLVLFDPQITPPVYWVLLAIGLLWGMRRQPGFHLWVLFVFVAYTLFMLSSIRFLPRIPSPGELLGNPIYNLRSQILPASFLILIAAGSASAWMAFWGPRRRLAILVGAPLLAALCAIVVVRSRTFLVELDDQQLEWSFLLRAVPQLPEGATVLTAVEAGGANVAAFPDVLASAKGHELVDVRRAIQGTVTWPLPSPSSLFYQGMYCHFAVLPEDPLPNPLSAPCAAVYERYVLEPLWVEDLAAEPYMPMRYASDRRGPLRIGFFRLKALR